MKYHRKKLVYAMIQVSEVKTGSRDGEKLGEKLV